MTLFTPERNRILSNFVRMFSSLLVGIFLVRQLLSVGPNAYGLYAFAVTGFGISIIIREVLRVSFIPFLSQNMSENGSASQSYIASVRETMSIAVFFGLAAASVMIGVTVFLPIIGFKGEQSQLGQAFFMLRAISALLMIIVYPLFLSILVQEKQVLQNVFLTIERLIELIAIIITLSLFQNNAEYKTLMIFAVISLGFSMLFYLAIFLSANIGVKSKILPSLPKKSTLKQHWSQLSTGLKDILGPLLYFRFNLIFLTAIFGPAAALILGLGVQFSGYIRQVNQVLIAGLDARFARASFTKEGSPADKKRDLRNIFSSVSRLQGLVIFFLIGFLILFLPELLHLWLGDRLVNSPTNLTELKHLIYVLMPGIAANALAQSWIIMQTGAGKLKGFVNYILGTAVLNPLLLGLFIFLSKADLYTAIFVAAALYSALNIICFLGIIPVVIAKQLNENPALLLRPFLGPLLASIMTLVITQLGIQYMWQDNIFATVAVFGFGFLLSFGYFVIHLARKPIK